MVVPLHFESCNSKLQNVSQCLAGSAGALPGGDRRWHATRAPGGYHGHRHRREVCLPARSTSVQSGPV